MAAASFSFQVEGTGTPPENWLSLAWTVAVPLHITSGTTNVTYQITNNDASSRTMSSIVATVSGPPGVRSKFTAVPNVTTTGPITGSGGTFNGHVAITTSSDLLIEEVCSVTLSGSVT